MALGVIFIVIGIMNYCGNVSTIHRYHRTRVRKNDMPRYGKCIGVGIVVCVALFIFAQLKYNKGIF